MNEKLEALNQEIEKTEKKLQRAQHEEKMLEHQIKTLTRKERTHRLCTRAAMLESYLPHPEAITDEQVSLFLKLLFHKDSTRQLMEKVFAGNGNFQGEDAGRKRHLVVTKEARLGLNGPQVIEQEAGVTEYDSKDKPFIWSMTGGEIRYETGFADELAVDDVDAVRTAIAKCFAQGIPESVRTDRVGFYLPRLAGFDASQQVFPEITKALFSQGDRK